MSEAHCPRRGEKPLLELEEAAVGLDGAASPEPFGELALKLGARSTKVQHHQAGAVVVVPPKVLVGIQVAAEGGVGFRCTPG